MKSFLLALLFFPSLIVASTIEVVRLYQPLSLHGTDGAGEHQEVDELLQASVMATPYALSGAFPEDLVKAVALPNKLRTNTEGYEVAEVNLVILSGLTIDVTMEDANLIITLDVSKLSIPEEIDLTTRQILKMTISSIIKTLQGYYSHDEETLTLYCDVEITGTTESNASLADLTQKFTIGE